MFCVRVFMCMLYRSVYTAIGNRFWDFEQSSLRSKFVFISSCYNHKLLAELLIPSEWMLVCSLVVLAPSPSSSVYVAASTSVWFDRFFVGSTTNSSVPICVGDCNIMWSIVGAVSFNSHFSILPVLSALWKRVLLLVLLHELLLGTAASFTTQPIFVVIASIDDLRLCVTLLLALLVGLLFKLLLLLLLLFMVDKLLLLLILWVLGGRSCCSCWFEPFQCNADVAGGEVAKADIDIWSRNDAVIILLQFARFGSKFDSKFVRFTVCVAVSANLTHPLSPRDAKKR